MEPRELALEIARIIEDKKGEEIVILDLDGIADIARYFVIATGSNNRLVDAIVDEIENVLRPLGEHAFAIEGREDNTWALMDFGNVIVHVFQPEARSYFRLEKLWGDAPRYAFWDGEAHQEQAIGSDRQPVSVEFDINDMVEVDKAADALITDEV